MHNALTVTHENNVLVTSEPFEQNVGHKRSEMEFLYCSTAAVWLCLSHSRLNHFCLEQSLHSALHAGKTNGPPGLGNTVHLSRGFLHTSVPSRTPRFSLICEQSENQIRR